MEKNNSYTQLVLPLRFDKKINVKSREVFLPNAQITLCPDFFGKAESDEIFTRLNTEAKWKQEEIYMYGQHKKLPRLTAWYGDKDSLYTYSNIKMNPNPWNPLLKKIKGKIDSFCGEDFNSVLINFYRDGSDSISWHSDDEKELGEKPIIASLSFGESRYFKLKNKCDSQLKFEVELKHGMLLIMRGETQRFWQHHIPKTRKPVGPRINLTFRKIFSS